MRSALFKNCFVVSLMLVLVAPAQAKGDDFNSVVKMIEQFYHVKHESIPFLARAGMKAATTAAKLKGGTARRIAEAGSVKLAVFENQSFEYDGEVTQFRNSLNAALNDTWTPFVQYLAPIDKEQSYIFLRAAGDKFNVLLVTIESKEATVIQITVSPANLALLLKDPEGMSKAITDEATINDQE
ncbi:MAG: hypothetical protein C5B55_12135 [Blastocatellia bacterium]|nr:MAG: hypothetical protein C5B55_12135 [Blastocatellia bacterium]